MFVQTTWGIGIARGAVDRLLVSGHIPNVQFIPGSSARYKYLADPFPISIAPDGSLRLLCEEFDLWGENRGRIRYVEIRDGAVASIVPSLELPGHASFPFLLREGDDLFCIPETCGSRRIEMHRAIRLPDVWQHHALLVDDFPGVDPTIFRFGNRWWLAATSRDDREYENLYLRYADVLAGPWLPHSRNPVKSDSRSARPAGTPFVYGGNLYRPAQDCSNGYGRRVTINRIDVLTPDQFQETTVATIEPDPAGPFTDGLHTINFIDGWIVIDGRRDFFDLFKQVKKQILARVIRRLRRRA
jgi:hypothetical protein